MPALTHALVSLDQAIQMILEGRACCIAADEQQLRRLPRGAWIGGTIPYFMAAQGGLSSREQVFVTELPRVGGTPQLRVYDRATLPSVCTDAPENGFSMMVLPAFSAIHETFAQDAPDYTDMYMKPLVGWIAGVHLDDLGAAKPMVIDGSQGRFFEDAAVVMHVPLPTTLLAHVDIINLFKLGDGPVIEFEQGGFGAGDCRLNGAPANLHDWMVAERIDTRLPLVADYHGAIINVSVKALDATARRVEFYAPVFAGVPYRVAQPVGDYSSAFATATQDHVVPGQLVFCCNCILNYAYGELEGRKTGELRGPMTFGEIGYQLLNQTLVHLSVTRA